MVSGPHRKFTEDGWLTANQTTLGADNGIAIAMAMVAATDDKLGHPPLELLFTTDEETGEDARVLLPFTADENLPTHSSFRLVGGDHKATSADTTQRAIDTVFAYPHGVADMSNDIAGLMKRSKSIPSARFGSSWWPYSSPTNKMHITPGKTGNRVNQRVEKYDISQPADRYG